jgi:uncharacterized repeat protein (TIGR01451 family)
MNPTDLATLTVVVKPKSTATTLQVNKATVNTLSETNYSNNTSEDGTKNGEQPIIYPDLTITKTHDHTKNILVGDNVEFKLTITNIGSTSTSTATTIVDTIPSGFTYVSSNPSICTYTTTINCTLTSSISPSQQVPVTITLKASTTPNQSTLNKAEVQNTADKNSTNNVATDEVEVYKLEPDMLVNLSHTQSANIVTHTIDVKNIGLAVARNPITVVTTIPSGLQYISNDSNCTYANKKVTCTITSDLAKNEYRAIKIQTKYIGGDTTTKVEVVGVTDETILTNNTTQDVLGVTTTSTTLPRTALIDEANMPLLFFALGSICFGLSIVVIYISPRRRFERRLRKS